MCVSRCLVGGILKAMNVGGSSLTSSRSNFWVDEKLASSCEWPVVRHRVPVETVDRLSQYIAHL